MYESGEYPSSPTVCRFESDVMAVCVVCMEVDTCSGKNGDCGVA